MMMTDQPGFDVLYKVLAVLVAVAAPALLWWLGRTFPTRAEVTRELTALADRLERTDERLDAGARRFAVIETAVGEVKRAADDALRAAEGATRASEQIADIRVEIAELRGDLKALSELLQRVERNAALMLEGHLRTGES